MPVSEALRRLSEDPGFWTGATSPPPHPDAATGPLPQENRAPAELRVSLPVTAGYGLVLEIDLVAGERTLGLRAPASSEPIQLGWTGTGRPYPAALRWWELDLCARVIALEDPTLPHPGLVVALLSPFAPATPDDDPAEIAAVRAAAYRALRRDAPPTPPAGPETAGPETAGPEQDPLPIFADDRWWPRPQPQHPPRVLDEATVSALAAPADVHLEVRGGRRFPRAELADLVRRAAERLSGHARDDCYAAARPLARNIAGTGDLRPVPRLLAALTEAGCDHPTVLDALSEPLVDLEACWMVETLAGAEPGSLLRRHLWARPG
ncbi:hypothetical protein EV385_2827 [Krasilnikovia cinnamomea]|uniref:Uncharacterized protein n=1 Tax=Krasilnikovia cinnamomea TaxID=349313 RepID=A0A4Q7ZLD6_9ACTN|nr:hypothetical protein EV385_2827 [Krasilnikovia cinnamomea]